LFLDSDLEHTPAPRQLRNKTYVPVFYRANKIWVQV